MKPQVSSWQCESAHRVHRRLEAADSRSPACHDRQPRGTQRVVAGSDRVSIACDRFPVARWHRGAPLEYRGGRWCLRRRVLRRRVHRFLSRDLRRGHAGGRAEWGINIGASLRLTCLCLTALICGWARSSWRYVAGPNSQRPRLDLRARHRMPRRAPRPASARVMISSSRQARPKSGKSRARRQRRQGHARSVRIRKTISLLGRYP